MNLWHGPAVDGYRRPCDVATAPRVNHDGANQLPNTDKSVAEVYIGSGAGFQNQDYPVFSSDSDWIRIVNF